MVLSSVAPSIDYSHNMRILKLPKSTQVNSLIYRLKASDPDQNSKLQFGINGIEARSLIDIIPVSHSWNEADVYLKTNLNNYYIEQQHNFNENNILNLSLYVTDGNLTTQVESTILITDPDSEILINQQQQIGDHQHRSSSSSLSFPSSPFLNTKHIIHVPEDTKPDQVIGQVTVLESDSNELPVRFELRGKGSDKFSIRYVFGPRGQSRGELILAQPIDYETQNLFALKVLALNGWTDTRFDTRNVVTMDLVITVEDVQDTGPVFVSPPRLIALTNTLKPGDFIAKVEAQDGDFGDQRAIQYALDAGSPISNYFQIGKLDGQISLIKPIEELILHASWDSSSWTKLIVLASEQTDPSSYDHLWPLMYSRQELPLMLVDETNEPPKFLGGWQSKNPRARLLIDLDERSIDLASSSVASDSILHAYLFDSSSDRDPSGLAVEWYTNGTRVGTTQSSSQLVDNIYPNDPDSTRPLVRDLGLGLNGTFKLSLVGEDARLFRIEPSFPISRQATFTLLVVDSLPASNWSLFDRESSNSKQTFKLTIVAQDFGSPQRLSTRIECQIDLLDTNDNVPQFETDLYTFSVYENAQKGQLLGTIRARDPDIASAGSARVRYGSLTGHGNQLFKLNPESGQLTLDGSLDREQEFRYLLLAEAFDSGSSGRSNFTRIIINVLDVNDNAPIFLQSSYDSVLQMDGTFHQPLFIRAIDSDEPGTANSQVAYEIIAGNRDEQFVIDSLSGAIYPAGHQPPNFESTKYDASPAPILLPSEYPNRLPDEITTRIKPFTPSSGGKIFSGLEVEETTWQPRARPRIVDRENVTGHQGDHSDQRQVEDLSKAARKRTASISNIETMLSMESETNSDVNTRSLINRYSSPTSNSKLPPMITLVVRAHDYGIPSRSSTARVNIYNQALLTRTLSVILNGTAEQIESRTEAIERAYSSITGSKAQIEAVETLSDSSSLCVAHVRLTVPQHNLVDLTDLTALIDAIDYRPHSYAHSYSHYYPPQHESGPPTSATIRPYSNNNIVVPPATIRPGSSAPANITSTLTNHIFGDPHNPLIESNLIERRLLIYIIIVVICILSLLVIWMIYWCNQEDRRSKSIENTKMLNTYTNRAFNGSNEDGLNEKSRTGAKSLPKTAVKSTDSMNSHSSPLANNLITKMRPNSLAVSPSNSVSRLTLSTTGIGQQLKPDRYSMYNGQVWFEPLPVVEYPQAPKGSQSEPQRRVLSAPSTNGANNIHSALASAIKVRQEGGPFFPNVAGYSRNLASIERQGDETSQQNEKVKVRGHKRAYGNKRRVAPIDSQTRSGSKDKGTSERYEKQTTDQQTFTELDDIQPPGARSSVNNARKARPSSSLSSGTRSSTSGTLVLDSDQELLGFDSTGTPIIATIAARQDHLPKGVSIEVDRMTSGQRDRPVEVQSKDKESREDNKRVGDEKKEEKLQAEVESSPMVNKTCEQGQSQRRPESGRDIMSELTDRLNQRKQETFEKDKLDEQSEKPNETVNKTTTTTTKEDTSADRTDSPEKNDPKGRRGKLQRKATEKSLTSSDTESNSTVLNRLEGEMKNGDLLKKKSIFAITYDGLAAEKIPVD